ncbi:ABC transporter substrate-binding protein [Anabaena cylindrica FACHB-243]|uniref:Extracellular ligand-binding receptor n=1 Tax=Anabaena cylindrica (strain ATCC 27899 / PCC 7122) TaxID=272123 RepID=K9ZA70_ANACC|nr:MULTISPECIES: ABC transporter substrate-binding protein [Anabaena]AFZ56098.1 Extracellular ligand-binding receptor [Anabaena cylindrica PCC 7122]MBD2417329.1 ABC transporter substrate-binding protein [Anabaena cylindrica FACHB-243]MBY5284068.1 ABC transporter substrate-binding protein [Anabaena sp. CCAP 1446/1C]MBY5310756.1 ABC transporter substrate-binding protein [Anabaena sp. CCAP 1446/1C]MCM2404410.1 ABC transporter substrate-binding protein [Anabaena sp. CCAP 1446/1C]
MGKLVIFEIGEGSFEKGFPVKIRIAEDGKPHFAEIYGRFPADLEIPQTYYEWQSAYYKLPGNWLITVPQTQITNVSTTEVCDAAAQKLKSSFNAWLNQPSVRKLERQFLQKIGEWDNVRFILETQDSLLRRLPWHLWEIFHTSHIQPEVVISSEYKPSTMQLKIPVKILAILGNSQEIDIQKDLQALTAKLPGAIIEPLLQPSRQEIVKKLWNQSWDILFFAGHSCSQEGDSWGEIQINDNESLSLLDLRYSLGYAVKKGLKLAIFNSCDGLGLARNLADLKIPYIIVMREPVPDIVAQHFLEYFLTVFASGESLYTSVQQARVRLQEELENEYPCASWIPVIFQNPAAALLKYPQPRNFQKMVAKSVTVTMLFVIIGAVLWLSLQEIKLRNRFSYGEKILFSAVTNLNKEEAIKAFWWKNYNQAVNKLITYLQEYPNDPEALIYLENAKISYKEVIKIGVAVPIGSNPSVAQEILRGLAQAQQEINNDGGVNGKFLQIQIANDDNNPEIAKQVAKRFVENADILAVVGHNSSDASVPAADIYQAGKLVMISPTSSSTKLTDRQDRTHGNYIYRTVISFTTTAETVAEYAKNNKKNKIVICSDSKATDQSFEQAFVNMMDSKGLELINDINCDFAADNFRSEQIIQKAIDKKATAILLNPQVDRINPAIELAKSNQGKFLLLGNPSLETQETLAAGNAVNGMIMAVPWNINVADHQAFVQNANRLWGEKSLITWRTATAFDATKVVATAMQKKGSTRINIQQALSNNFSFLGATGTIRFLSWGDRTGDRIGKAVLVQIQPDPSTPTGYNFVPK